MNIRMDTQGMPVPPTRRASGRVCTADVVTQRGRYLADVPTRHFSQLTMASRQQPTTEIPKALTRTHQRDARNRFLAFVGLGALCLVGIIHVCTWIGATFERSSVQQVYGESHAVILEARVGHHDQASPTIFIGFPRNGRLYLVELAGGDPHKTQVYPLGHYAGNAEEMQLVLAPRDVNTDGKLDLVITTRDSQFGTILYNNGKTFQPDEPKQKGESNGN